MRRIILPIILFALASSSAGQGETPPAASSPLPCIQEPGSAFRVELSTQGTFSLAGWQGDATPATRSGTTYAFRLTGAIHSWSTSATGGGCDLVLLWEEPQVVQRVGGADGYISATDGAELRGPWRLRYRKNGNLRGIAAPEGAPLPASRLVGLLAALLQAPDLHRRRGELSRGEDVFAGRAETRFREIGNGVWRKERKDIESLSNLTRIRTSGGFDISLGSRGLSSLRGSQETETLLGGLQIARTRIDLDLVRCSACAPQDPPKHPTTDLRSLAELAAPARASGIVLDGDKILERLRAVPPETSENKRSDNGAESADLSVDLFLLLRDRPEMIVRAVTAAENVRARELLATVLVRLGRADAQAALIRLVDRHLREATELDDVHRAARILPVVGRLPAPESAVFQALRRWASSPARIVSETAWLAMAVAARRSGDPSQIQYVLDQAMGALEEAPGEEEEGVWLLVLANLEDPRARAAAEARSDHPSSWVRESAELVLRRTSSRNHAS